MANLLIKVDQIEEPRQLEQRPLTRAYLDEVIKDAPAYKVTGAAEVQARFTRVGDRDVLLEGTTELTLRSACRRCLTSVDSDVPLVFTLNLVVRGADPKSHGHHKGKDEEDVEIIDETAPDEELFDGETIDLGPIMREQILLGLPSIEPLCKESCKGLCATCGQDLNEKNCGHDQKPPDPRWAALKNLKV